MPNSILVVDYKANVRSLIQDYLSKQGFRVFTACNGREALFVARQEKPDLILLDIMMPEMDGYEFIRLHRKEHETPIILLTAKIEETDKVLGLELGADDYITKPFRMRELVARIHAVLRRVGNPLPVDISRCKDVILNISTHEVTVNGKSVDLTPTEFDLLAKLLSAPGRVFSRADLLEAVQGVAFASLERSINVHVSNLRSKIEPDADNPIYIETVFGVGYRFCVDSATANQQ